MKVIYDPMTMRVPIKSWCDGVEASAFEQAKTLSKHPAIFKHVALMPDCHAGMGMPIGGVVALYNAISPNMVGVDIGCGMCAVQTHYKLADIGGSTLRNIRNDIAQIVPVGFSHRDPNWLADTHPGILMEMNRFDNFIVDDLEKRMNGVVSIEKVKEQIGTLGGGNHFIEIQRDTDGYIWVMIHSGSRNIGKQIADFYNKKAIDLCRKWHSDLPNKDLAFFPYDSDLGQEYYDSMNFALKFAYENRRVMMMILAKIFLDRGIEWDSDWQQKMINIHHNYATMENHFGSNVVVHRKGATLARAGTIGIIPGSMGTSSYIVRGLGNKESFNSCSHGAGRKMSRSKAKKTIDMEDFTKVMQGVDYTPIKDNLDEAPQAYKDIDQVMEQQQDLVSIEVKLTPLAVVKG